MGDMILMRLFGGHKEEKPKDPRAEWADLKSSMNMHIAVTKKK